MDGALRRKKILEYLSVNTQPVSGAALAKRFKVSRQSIVQDIALLRAANHKLLSTNKGYLLNQDAAPKQCRVFKINYTPERLEQALCVIVDAGGQILDITVQHPLYSRVRLEIHIASRKDVQEFMEKLADEHSQPLDIWSPGTHFYTVEAPSIAILHGIEADLRACGLLAK